MLPMGITKHDDRSASTAPATRRREKSGMQAGFLFFKA
jgi:hypothetical protein